MSTATLNNVAPSLVSTPAPHNISADFPGTPVVADEDLPPQEKKKEKKDKKDKKDKKSKDKKGKKEKKADIKKDAAKEAKEPKEPKSIRQAVGIIVIDPATMKVLMLQGRKKEDTYVLPRGDCQTEPSEEHPEKAAIRVLFEKAGVTTPFLSSRVGSYAQSNKKGKTVAQHWMYEVNNPTLLETWPESDRARVWVPYSDALKATEDKRMSYLALEKCSLAK